MKISKQCPKCKSTDICRIGAGGGNAYYLGLKHVLPYRYICCKCGYTEEYIETAEDIMKIQNSKYAHKI